LRYNLSVSDNTFRLNFKDLERADFLVLAMNTRYFRIQVEQAISGAEGLANNLQLSSLKDLHVAAPPLGEAINIANWLMQESGYIDALLDRTDRENDLMRVYRTRLIDDVLMGKLYEREATAWLSENAHAQQPVIDDGYELTPESGEEDDGEQYTVM